MENRNLDGVYFRIKRDGIWDNVCFSDLSDEEKIKVMSDKNTEWLKSMCIILANTIRKMGDRFDIVCED